MTDYELISTILGVLALLISFGVFFITFLAFFDKKR